jgi:uncharacterized membrane protein
MRAEVEALVLAGVAALTFDAGMLLLKVRGDRLPALGLPPRPAALRAYVMDPLWMLGLVLQPSGYGLYLWALGLGPLAVVQPVMSAGIVLFVGFAVVILGERIHAPEWAAIAAVAVGLFLLGSSLAAGGESAATASGAWAVGGYSAAMLAVAAGAAAWTRGRAPGVGMGIWSGVLLGLGSLWAKGLASAFSHVEEGQWLVAVAAEPYLYLTLAGNLVGFAVLLNALRDSRAGVVFTLSSTLSNVVPILGGMVAMGERLPEGPVAAALRVASLVLTLGGAAYLARFDPAARAAGAPQIIDTPESV